MLKVHELKILPEYFADVESGAKKGGVSVQRPRF